MVDNGQKMSRMQLTAMVVGGMAGAGIFSCHGHSPMRRGRLVPPSRGSWRA